jgi:hypothetical protein
MKKLPDMAWEFGRVTIPHHDPEGDIVNIYGRAIGDERVPKKKKHTHLPGPRGIFNAPACSNLWRKRIAMGLAKIKDFDFLP